MLDYKQSHQFLAVTKEGMESAIKAGRIKPEAISGARKLAEIVQCLEPILKDGDICENLLYLAMSCGTIIQNCIDDEELTKFASSFTDVVLRVALDLGELGKPTPNTEKFPPETWWWLSYSNTEGPVGVVIVQGASFKRAYKHAINLGINQPGEIHGGPIPPKAVIPKDKRNRLLPPEVAKTLLNVH